MSQSIEVQRYEVFVELIVAVEIDMLSDHRGDAIQDLGVIKIASALQLAECLGQDQAVVALYGVSDEPGAFIGHSLLDLGASPEADTETLRAYNSPSRPSNLNSSVFSWIARYIPSLNYTHLGPGKFF